LFPHFSPSEARARVLAIARKWSGPVLAALGLLAIAAMALLARENPLARWILTETLAPARVLPLIGLGAACALAGTQACAAALLLFGLGIIGGFVAQDWLLWILYDVPQAPTHLFQTGPISYLAVGAALVPGARLRRWLLPIAAFVAGAMLALVIMLTDPSLREPVYTWLPALVAFWLVAAVALTLRAFRRAWFPIFGRILGSWLLAIGLLYGAASLLPRRELPPPPAMPLPDPPKPAPGADRPIPDGADRLRRP
jgi:hypothetical protein